MTERRQFCPRGHDTFKVGRDSSYRCLRCKRESAAAARDARRAEEEEARRGERAELVERIRIEHARRQALLARARGGVHR